MLYSYPEQSRDFYGYEVDPNGKIYISKSEAITCRHTDTGELMVKLPRKPWLITKNDWGTIFYIIEPPFNVCNKEGIVIELGPTLPVYKPQYTAHVYKAPTMPVQPLFELGSHGYQTPKETPVAPPTGQETPILMVTQPKDKEDEDERRYEQYMEKHYGALHHIAPWHEDDYQPSNKLASKVILANIRDEKNKDCT